MSDRWQGCAWKTWLRTCKASGSGITQTTTWTSITSATLWAHSASWNLSSLDLQGCSRIPTDALVDLMEGLPCLTKLNLSETQCNTQVLSAVGSCCRRLRDLDVSGCKRLSPGSLLHLAYDPIEGSFCCPLLESLTVGEPASRTSTRDLLCALVFLLLALPRLKLLDQTLVTEAIALLHRQQFDAACIPAGFPSSEELLRRRIAALPEGGGSGLRLPLTQMLHVSESSLPVVCAVCPHVAKATVFLEDAPGFSQCFLSWRRLTHLTVNCMGNRDLRELLPVTASCGAQLQSLSLGGFFFEDEPSFPALLSHCPNLREFSAAFCAPPKSAASWDRRPAERGLAGVQEEEDWGWDQAFSLHGFPDLCALRVIFSDTDEALPHRHTLVLRASLLALLRRSPRLESLELVHLPFPLDGFFEKVLGPPGTALVHLRTLSLAQNEVSVDTIHLLLSLDNQLGHLTLDGCPDIHQRHYSELLRRVRREGLEVAISWS